MISRRHRSLKPRVRFAKITILVLAALIIPAIVTNAIQTKTATATAPGIDYLPNISLEDQFEHKVTLASLKGKPAVVGFIHTSCGGVCQMLTAKMKNIADSLQPSFGSKITLITITTDPKEDGPKQLASYAKAQGAVGPGWVFLTGKPKEVAQVLKLYGVPNDPDDALTHVFELRLIDPDGGQLKTYKGANIESATVTSDIRSVLAHRD